MRAPCRWPVGYMFGEVGSIVENILLVALTTGGPVSALWQILAILALAGIVIVVVLAIIEPGPLVKRRPYSGKERSSGSEGGGQKSPNPHSAPDSTGGILGQDDGG